MMVKPIRTDAVSFLIVVFGLGCTHQKKEINIMKNCVKVCLTLIVVAVFGVTSPGFGEEAEEAGSEISLSVGVCYDRVNDDLSPKTEGHEFTIPLSVKYARENLSAELETNYTNVNVDFGNDSDASLSGLTDTKLSASYTFSNFPVNITPGIELNLPTGKADLNEDEASAVWFSEDGRFKVDEFGEGLNVGVTLNLSKEFETLTAEIEGMYTNYGEYDPTTDFPDDDYDPGDEIGVFTAIEWYAAPQLTIYPSIKYIYTTKDTTNAEEDFQTGPQVNIGCEMTVAMEQAEIFVSIYDYTTGKNKELSPDTGKLETEPENSNRNEFESEIDISYDYSESLTFRGLGEFWYYSDSDAKDEESELPFESKLIRFAVGPGFDYTLNENISFNGLVKYVRIHEDSNAYFDEETTYQGVNLEVGAKYSF